MAEIMERFSQDHVFFLSDLSEAERDLQALITNNLGVSIYFSYFAYGDYEFSNFNAAGVWIR